MQIEVKTLQIIKCNLFLFNQRAGLSAAKIHQTASIFTVTKMAALKHIFFKLTMRM